MNSKCADHSASSHSNIPSPENYTVLSAILFTFEFLVPLESSFHVLSVYVSLYLGIDTKLKKIQNYIVLYAFYPQQIRDILFHLQ